jgi:hypothetical protein
MRLCTGKRTQKKKVLLKKERKREKNKRDKNGESFVLPFDDASAHAQHHTRSNKRRQTINQNDSVEIKEKKRRRRWVHGFLFCVFFLQCINQPVSWV